MKPLLDDLWQTETESPFRGLTTHAYLLSREGGNVLFYNTSQPRDIDQMAELGGVSLQLLSHRDELGDSLLQLRERFNCRLGGHQAEQAEFARYCKPDIVFTSREQILNDIEVIPTPGHTPGSCCFQVRSSTGRVYLFTGDTLYLSNEGWKPGLLSFSDPDKLAESLALLQTLEPDVVFSSAFTGQSGYQEVSGHWQEKVSEAMTLLRA